jgi:hypothetical protein
MMNFSGKYIEAVQNIPMWADICRQPPHPSPLPQWGRGDLTSPDLFVRRAWPARFFSLAPTGGEGAVFANRTFSLGFIAAP